MMPLWVKYEPIVLEWRAKYERPPKGQFGEFVEELVLAMSKEREVDVAAFAKRLELRGVAWKSLGKMQATQ